MTECVQVIKLKLNFIFSRRVHRTQRWYTICNAQLIKVCKHLYERCYLFKELLSPYTAKSIATGQKSSTSVTTASECPVTKMKLDIHTCKLCVISGFHHEVDKNSSLLGYSLLKFWDNLSDSIETDVWVLRQLIGHLNVQKCQ